MNEIRSTHPSEDDLSAFGLGDLDEDVAAAVETHIEDCQQCAETLLGLSSSTDTFVAALKRADSKRTEMEQASSADQETLGLSSADANSQPPAERVGDIPPELVNHPRYRIVKRLGRGGMGDVFMAEHKLMNRPVAVKLIAKHLVANPQAVERFHREVQAAARLSHPNIVTAYDAEKVGGVHILVMEFVDGTELSQVVKQRGPLPVVEACKYVRKAAEGLQKAHEQGMVHRDIKPHNLMLTREGEVKVLDFGLASIAAETPIIGDKSVAAADDSTTRLTSFGSTMGTPDYISPEQIRDARTADTRSDMYSLGCTLYFLLTGSSPFPADSVDETLEAHLSNKPVPLAQKRADVPIELSNIVEKMMEKQPADRFRTPVDLIQALAPFCSDAEPKVAPKPKRRFHSAWRSAISILIAVVCELAALTGNFGLAQAVILSVLGFGALAWAIAPILRGASRTIWKVGVATASAAAMLTIVVVVNIQTDKGTVEIGIDPDVANLHNVQIILKQDGKRVARLDLADTERRRIERQLPSGNYEIEIQGASDNFRMTVWSKTADTNNWGDPEQHDTESVCLHRRGAILIRLMAREKLQELQGPTIATLRKAITTDRFRPLCVAYSPDGAWLASGDSDGQIKLDATATDVKRNLVDHGPREVWSLAFSHDGKWLATAVNQRGFRLYEVPPTPFAEMVDGRSKPPVFELPAEAREARSVAFSPDYKTIAVGMDKVVYLWDMDAGGKQRSMCSAQNGMVSCLAFSPDGETLASASRDGQVVLIAVTDGFVKGFRHLQAHENGATCVTYSPDGKLLASAGHDGTVKLWNGQTADLVRVLEGHSKGVTFVAIHPNKPLLASASLDGTVRLWDTSTGNLRQILRGHEDEVHGVAFSPNGDTLVSASWDKTIKLWDLNFKSGANSE